MGFASAQLRVASEPECGTFYGLQSLRFLMETEPYTQGTSQSLILVTPNRPLPLPPTVTTPQERCLILKADTQISTQ